MNAECHISSNARNRSTPYLRMPAPIPVATCGTERSKSSGSDRAARLVGRSGVAEMVTAWGVEDGAPIRTSPKVRAVLTAWVALALEDRRLSVENVADLLSQQPGVMASLDLSPRSLREQVRHTTARILDTIDAYPLPVRGKQLRKQS